MVDPRLTAHALSHVRGFVWCIVIQIVYGFESRTTRPTDNSTLTNSANDPYILGQPELVGVRSDFGQLDPFYFCLIFDILNIFF